MTRRVQARRRGAREGLARRGEALVRAGVALLGRARCAARRGGERVRRRDTSRACRRRWTRPAGVRGAVRTRCPRSRRGPVPDHRTLREDLQRGRRRRRDELLVRPRARAAVSVQRRHATSTRAAARCTCSRTSRTRSGSRTAGPIASARPAATSRCTRSRSRGATLTETTAERRQYPSHWRSVHTATGLSRRRAQVHHLQQRRGHAARRHEHRHRADDPHGHDRQPAGDDLRRARHRADRQRPRPLRPDDDHAAPERPGLHGHRHHPDAGHHARPGETTTLKAQFGAITTEIPESTTEYERYRDYDADDGASRPSSTTTTAGGSTTSPTSTSRTRTSRRCRTTGRS